MLVQSCRQLATPSTLDKTKCSTLSKIPAWVATLTSRAVCLRNGLQLAECCLGTYEKCVNACDSERNCRAIISYLDEEGLDVLALVALQLDHLRAGKGQKEPGSLACDQMQRNMTRRINKHALELPMFPACTKQL